MSLDWSIKRIKNRREVCFRTFDHEADEGELSNLTESLIWGTMAIGIGSITEKNWREVYFRTFLWERTVGAYRKTTNKDGVLASCYVTAEDIQAHIGLSTNVSKESDAKFYKKLKSRGLEFVKEEVTV